MTTSEEIFLAFGSSAAGVILTLVFENLREAWRFRRELKDNNHIDLSGTNWVAAWQTSVDGKEVLNTESIIIKQRGGLIKMWNAEISPGNPKAGYKWEGQLQFLHGRDLMGHYFSTRNEQNTNKGIMFFNYNSARKEFIGRWVGASYDGPLLSGFGVIAKSRERAFAILKELLEKHPDSVPIITNTI
jgi:hypothetical protein